MISSSLRRTTWRLARAGRAQSSLRSNASVRRRLVPDGRRPGSRPRQAPSALSCPAVGSAGAKPASAMLGTTAGSAVSRREAAGAAVRLSASTRRSRVGLHAGRTERHLAPFADFRVQGPSQDSNILREGRACGLERKGVGSAAYRTTPIGRSAGNTESRLPCCQSPRSR